jgi:carboxypeptidase C (cathepsin A)
MSATMSARLPLSARRGFVHMALLAIAAGSAGGMSVHAAEAQPAAATVVAVEAMPGVAAPIVTRHTARIGSQQVAYTTSFAATVLRDAKGVPQATISATAYVRDGVSDTKRRPVIFLFNGGPGASSSPLHFSSLGPRRIVEAEGKQRSLADNDESPLDVADLVFIDPVGTGFSRVLPGGDGHPYWTMDGDAKAAMALVNDWLREHHREASPVYLCGQSYGGFRVAMMSKYAKDVPLAGLILVSPMLDASGTSEAPGNDLPYVLNLPSMSALAWYHNRIDRAGRTLEQQFAEATRFAQGEYASALQQGSALSTAERDRIAARMAALTGLPQKALADADLRISTDAFRSLLLAGQEIGRLDGRIIAAKRPPKTAAQPSGDPSLVVSGSRADFIKAYYRDELHVAETAPYVTLSFAVNGAWNWKALEGDDNALFYLNATPNIAALMKRQPNTRLMLAGGYYDLAVSYLSANYVLSHAGIAPQRVRAVGFASGHSPYDDAPGLHQFATEIRAFAGGVQP